MESNNTAVAFKKLIVHGAEGGLVAGKEPTLTAIHIAEWLACSEWRQLALVQLLAMS